MNGIELNVAIPGESLVEWIKASISDYGVENRHRLKHLLLYTYGTAVDLSDKNPVVKVDRQFLFGGWDNHNIGGIGVDHGAFLAHVFVYCMMENANLSYEDSIIVMYGKEKLGEWNPINGFSPNTRSLMVKHCVDDTYEPDEEDINYDIERSDCLTDLGEI